MKKLRAAVVGVGYLGSFHAQKYKNNPSVELVGVFDANPAQAQKVGEALGVPVFDQLSDLYGRVDLATVATSTQSHFEVASALIQKGIHVNVEKPITADSTQAIALLKLASEKNVKLTVGHIERFNPAFVKWRIMMGSPKYIEFERMGPFKARGADVSVVHDLMIHDIDLLMALKPGPIKDLRVQGAKHLSQSIDWAMVSITFASGLMTTLKASRVSPVPSRVIRSYDENAQWTVYLGSGEIDRVRYGGSEDSQIVAERITVEKADGLQLETDAFVSAVVQNKNPLISGEDGLLALQMVERICSELGHV